jgi:outer membrane murein-binding lipoprotein Lpp
VLGAVAGHVVAGISDMGARIQQAMQHADKLQAKELKADTAEIERDAKAAGADQAPAND